MYLLYSVMVQENYYLEELGQERRVQQPQRKLHLKEQNVNRHLIYFINNFHCMD